MKKHKKMYKKSGWEVKKTHFFQKKFIFKLINLIKKKKKKII